MSLRAPTALCSPIASLLVILTPLALCAATDTWVGGGTDNLLTNGTNWLAGAPPITGVDSLIFAGANTSNQNNFSNATFNGITFAGGASSFTLAGNSLHLGFQPTGQNITHTGDVTNYSSNPQTVNNALTLDPGKHSFTTGSAALNLHGPITQSLGSTAIFNPSAGPINVAGSGLTTSNGILGGWATIGADWATLDGGNNVVPYAGYANVAPGGTLVSNAASNVRIPLAGTAITLPSGTTNINSILFSGSNAAQTITIGANNKLVLGQNGGIFNTANFPAGSTTNRTLTVGGGTNSVLTAGDGINPAVITLSGAPFGSNTLGQFTITSAITDNGSAPVSVVLMGGYATLLNTIGNTNNTYTGGTYILSGRISQPVAGTFGTGPVYIFPGALINPGGGAAVTIANNMFIAGNGSSENNGQGAIRMFQNTNGVTTKLTGIVTLMADASVNSNGLTLPQIALNRHVAITNKITGPGGLGIASFVGNNNAGSGVVEIGSLDGTGIVANDYAGDTTINGLTGTTIVSGFRIGNSADNNIMPHGLTGSYAGGATGNVVLNGTANTRAGIFDVNGSTQTINGLATLAANGSPVSNAVVSGAAGGKLVVGDSNASAGFGGQLSDGAGTLAIQKIGSGKQQMNGTSFTTGAITIDGGTLALNGANVAAVADNGTTAVNAATISGLASTAGLRIGQPVTGTNIPAGAYIALINSATQVTLNVNTIVAGTAGVTFGTGSAAGTSTVTINNGGTLGGTGTVNGPITINGGGAIDPGAAGANTTGILTIGSNLAVGPGANLRFDATGSLAGQFDQINAGANTVTFSFGATITPSITSAGTYTLITSSAPGGISGPLPLIASGDTRLTYSGLAIGGGGTSLTINASGSVANVTWTGAGGNTWDLHSTASFTSAAPTNPNLFYNGDNVIFSNSPANITLNSIVAPGSVTFSNTSGTFAIAGSGSIAGAGSVAVSGSGAATLATNNTYSGGTTLSSGTLNINKAGAIGSGPLSISGGALGNTSGRPVAVSSTISQTWSGDFAYNGPSDLDLGTGAVTLSATRSVTVNACTLTVGGPIGDGGSAFGLTKNGTGTLALNGTSTFTGNSTINGGVVRVGSFSALGATSTGTITVGPGATLDVGGFALPDVATGFGSRTVTIAGAGAGGQGALVNTGSVGQANAFSSVTLAADAAIGGDARSTSGPPNNTGRFDIRGGTLTMGGFTLTKLGTNEVRLANITTTPGSFVINQGTLMFETPSSLDPTGSITVNSGGTLGLLMNSGSVINNPIFLNGANVNDASATSTTLGQNGTNLTLQGNSTFGGPNLLANLSIADKVTGSGSLTKTGISTLTLANTNTDTATKNNYSGGTNMNGGVVNFAALAALGTGPLSFNGGTLQYGSGLTDDVSVLPITLNSAGGTIDTNSNTPIMLAHNIVGAGGLTLKGNSTITLSGANTYAGATTIQNGTVIVGSAGALPANTALILGSATSESPFLDLAGQNISVSGLSSVASSNPTIGNSSTATNSAITFNGSATPTTFGGMIQDTLNGVGTKKVSLTVNSGKLTLTLSSTYTGATTVNGGTLALGQNGSLAQDANAATSLTLNGGTFAFAGSGQNQQMGSLSVLSNSTIDFGTGNASLHFNNAAPTFGGTLTISNWTGSSPDPKVGSGLDILTIGSANGGLTATQLANQIKFDGYPLGAQFTANANGEVVPSHAGYVAGDWNKSGALDLGDINTMLSALTDLNGFAAANGYTAGDLRVIGDLDASGSVTNADIQKELDLLSSAGLGSVAAVPEPGSWLLLALGGAALFAVHRRRGLRVS